jgi:hypothetical protein
MPALTPFEKRREERVSFEDQCLFSVEGKAVHLRLRDASRRGVGAFCRDTLKEGDQGQLLTKLPFAERTGRFDVMVCWCRPSDEAERKIYPYRVGFYFVPGAQPEAPARPRPEPVPKADPAEGSYRVKGSLLTDLAKMIRRAHDKPWQKWLTLEDMKILNDMIIPAAWYPLDTFRRAGVAAYNVFGFGRPDALRQWGRDSVVRMQAEVFKQFFDKKDPKAAIKNYVNVNCRVMDFLRIRAKEGADKSIDIMFRGDPSLREKFPELELYVTFVGGVAEGLAERNGAIEARSKALNELEAGDLFGSRIGWR